MLTEKSTSFRPFDNILIAFCEDLSKALFQLKEIQKYPDLAALAFWLRKSRIIEIQNHYNSLFNKNKYLTPRGMAFHIPPSNVDTMFVYSWILSLLVGNGNVIRMPSKKSVSSDLLLQVVQNIFSTKNYSAIANINHLISYGHEEEITELISAYADIRIIWGGDRTIQTIRQIPLKPQAKEIVFPDRYSFSIIDAQTYLSADEKIKKQLARDFFNDMYWFDQAACSW